MQLISWNVNGIRAAQRKGLLAYLEKNNPDVFCVQETKAHKDQLDEEITAIDGYYSYFAQAERKGYSGVALYTKQKPLSVEFGFNMNPAFDLEGRVIIAHFKTVSVYTIYYPNGLASAERLQFKLDFYDAFLQHAENLRLQGREIIFCGDVNTAHNEIDLARPKENLKKSGFLPIERAWLDSVCEKGYIDTFRHLYPDTVAYSWWDMKTRAKLRNVGWRLDYFFITPGLLDRLSDAGMQMEEDASDHCPVFLTLKGDTL